MFSAVSNAGGDMRTEFLHPEIAKLCRDLRREADKLPARRRYRIIAEHLSYFGVPVRETRRSS
jgi:hypothetical protein